MKTNYEKLLEVYDYYATLVLMNMRGAEVIDMLKERAELIELARESYLNRNVTKGRNWDGNTL